MRITLITAALLILGLGSAGPVGAQATVSFDIPVNVTQVHADIDRIRTVCQIASEAIVLGPLSGSSSTSGAWSNVTSSSAYSITGENLPPTAARQEVWVFGGQVVATMRVIILIPAEWLVNPIGKKVTYQCALMGFSRTAQKWGMFSDQSTELPFKLKVTPEVIQGEFVW